ncbi:methylamine utilization protein [Marinobacter fonticola]|uniref:methylamine utilization protein n=1 Tax=Marinobacter fonticola TaxID=2603215 RepID=UPI0011E71DC7|nr:methylamine utilization protein [Marinobacter fonticola]
MTEFSIPVRAALLAGLLLSACPLWALELSVRDRASGEPVADAVVSVPATPGADPLDSPATMAQQDLAFNPHLLVVPAGSAVDFPNRDNTQHHVYSFSPAKTFTIELYAGQPEAPIVFDTPGVVEVGCNIHDRMRGFIYVSGSSQTARTGAAGIARVTPPNTGAFEIEVWHERLINNAQPITVRIEAGAASPVIVSLELDPADSGSDPFSDLQRRFDSL